MMGKKLLVFASTFPRWENDEEGFVWEKIVNGASIFLGGRK